MVFIVVIVVVFGSRATSSKGVGVSCWVTKGRRTPNRNTKARPSTTFEIENHGKDAMVTKYKPQGVVVLNKVLAPKGA